MTWDQLQGYLKGKVFLVGLTFNDRAGKLIEQYQTSGTVEELTSDGIFRIRKNDGSIFQMPYDRDTIRKAGNGEYREKETGQIVKDPDFIMTWEIITDGSDGLEEVKQYGYFPRG